VKNFQSCRLVLAGFAILACTAAQSPCGGEPRDLIAAPQSAGTGSASRASSLHRRRALGRGDPTLAYAEWKQGVGCPTNVADPYACFASSDPADLLNDRSFPRENRTDLQ